MMEPGELKPCPFCGWKIQPPPCVLEGGVECPDCFAVGPTEDTEAEAINAWNTQPALEAALLRISEQQDLLKTVREAIDTLDEDELGMAMVPCEWTGDALPYSIRDELLARISAVLSPLGG